MINVIHQDQDLLVVEKPHDLLSVPGRGPDKQDCLISRLVEQGFDSALIVHRLDYATSGLMVIALNKATHKALSNLFQNRAVEKSYQALVAGSTVYDSGEVDQPLRCDWENRPLQIVDYEWGKRATTHWQVLARDADHTRLLLRPETGRSHQLRVHMQWLGHAICGDRFYAEPLGLSLSPRLCLHAQSLAFTHPSSGAKIQFHSDCPF
ncbi:RNA pseudouridine synthase ['Osedax' symbiont bacterium Rs2_46_30_T18]|nr:RNA pseudouridine synthase ['Osedax' symbiont bacterium Rs2_46_30_T18]